MCMSHLIGDMMAIYTMPYELLLYGVPAVQAPIGLNSSVNLNSNQFYFIGSTMDNNSRRRMCVYKIQTRKKYNVNCENKFRRSFIMFTVQFV